MRILVIQESDWLEKGPHQSHHLMERLSERGHTITVVDFEISWKQNVKKRIVSRRRVFDDVRKATDRGHVTVVRPAFIRLPVLDYLSLAFTHGLEIAKQIDEFKPDVVVGFGILNAFLAIRLCRRNGIPFIYYVIDELHRLVPQSSLRGIAKMIESNNVRSSSLVISINEKLRDYTVEMGADMNRTMIIRAGIDTRRFDPAMDGGAVRDEFGIGKHELVLFFMGWLYDFSGLREVAEELVCQERYRDVRLIVLGKGDLWKPIQEIQTRSEAGSRIILLDWRPYADVPKFIAASDVCILPAYSNDVMRNIVPIKVYEYMAMAKPVIATRLEGLVKEFGCENGVVFVENGGQVLERAVDLHNTAAARSAGQAAREFVEGNDWERITDRFESILRDRTYQTGRVAE